MPIVNGKKVRARYTSLKLDEISSVDNPAQPSATGYVIKRMEDADQAIANICKYVGVEDGAHTFRQVLHENKFSEQIWPFTDALSQSIRSIVGDKSLSGTDREEKIRASVEEFLGAVHDISPVVSKSLEGLLQKEVNMSKTVEQLEKELAAAEKRAADAEAKIAKMEGDKAEYEEKMEGMEADLEETKKALAAASDEVVKVEGLEVRKSEVGEAQFKLTKSLVEKDARREREVEAAKRFPSLPGTDVAKGALLKAIEDMEDETMKDAANALLDSAEKVASLAFERVGKFDPNAEPTRKQATDTFMSKVAEIAKRDGIAQTAAMQKARSEFPAEFSAYTAAVN
jgi:chromosome segregation ATPase